MKKAVFNWSGGKDSALALHYTLQNKDYQIETLLTSVNDKFDRISMHGVRSELLRQQALELKLPLQELRLPEQPTMSEYNTLLSEMNSKFKAQGITHSVFGDIFLEDLKTYREQQLANVGINAHFPLWKRNTAELIHEFIDLGFKTIVVCTKSELLGEEFVGKVITKDFLKELPKNVDPCGENGEFHTFVYDGPIFNNPINFDIGETIVKTYEAPKSKEDACFSSKPSTTTIGFHFCDLIPK
ncbi:MAG: diphthine--ammonia ligase [Flavobacteriaceae bacterium]